MQQQYADDGEPTEADAAGERQAASADDVGVCCNASRAMTSSVRSAVMMASATYGSVKRHVEQAVEATSDAIATLGNEDDSKKRQQRDLNVASRVQHSTHSLI